MALARILSALAALGLATAAPAVAQTYPDRPVRVVVSFPAGSGADIMCRFFIDRLSAASGGTFVADNRPGATGNIGSETVARAKPDGYTLLMGSSANIAGGPAMYKNLSWHPLNDFVYATTFAQLSFVLTVAATSPAKSVAEFTQLMKAKDGKAKFGFGNATGLVASSLYAHEAGFKVVSVAYKSNPQAVSDVAGGELDYVFSDTGTAVGQERAGKVRVLAVTTPERLSNIPNVPTMREVGLGNATVAPWWTLMAPAKTPADIIVRLEGWLNKIVSAPETREFLATQGAQPLPGSGTKAREMMAAALKEWERFVAIANITPQ